jgi:parallel beta-helix repeat protein
MEGGVGINKLITLLAAFLILASISGIGAAAEIIVKPGNSIQNSINSAVSGDTIIVKPGTYTENIKIVKDNLIIRSESGNPDDTIIQARSPSANVFLLQADNVKIKGFKISGSIKYGYAGICLSSGNHCTIENNKLSSNSFGIYLLNSKGNTISKNTVSESERGIYFKFSESNTLSENKVTGNREYGIVFAGANNNILSGNLVFSNERGIYFGTSDGNTLKSSTVRNNKVYGFSICGKCDKSLIYNNYFNDTTLMIGNGVGNAYSITKTAGTNIVGGHYIGGNYWAKPGGTGFSQKAVDKNGDGISDSAYTRIAGSKYSDSLPLVITSKSPATTTPVADFWGSPRSGNAPLSVTFSDTSTGTPTAWKWSFGDGTYSTQQNPVHKYSKAGNYTVTLTASNKVGSGTLTKYNYINTKIVSIKPNAAFSSSSISGKSPLKVQFTDKSMGTPTSWKWSFGDGTYSTTKNPAHTYSKAGKYTVSLTVKNAKGNSSATKSGYITVK